MGEHITYVGLDVHKETISVALAVGGRRGEVREHGQISNTPVALTRLSSKLAQPGVCCGSATRPDRAATAFSGKGAICPHNDRQSTVICCKYELKSPESVERDS